jgi:antitoxin Phd
MKPKIWALQDAKARFSELARRALTNEPQHVTVRGEPALVVLSETEYRRLTGRTPTRMTLADIFRSSPFETVDLKLERSTDTGRAVDL